MIKGQSFKKAAWVLKNEGPISFGKKSVKVAISKVVKEKHHRLKTSDEYNYLSNTVFQITEKDILKSKKVTSGEIAKVSSALWFLPYFKHITFGGIFTILRSMEYFAKQGVKTTIIIYDNKYLDLKKTKAEISKHFPGLSDVEIMTCDLERQSLDELPHVDIAFATIWMSAYFLLKYNNTKRKYYFIQDYEPLFYQAGSMYALAESTYRFGFTGVVNTPGLLWSVNQRHAQEGVSFVPAVDKRYYYPFKKKETKKVKIFFYARPGNPRNAFELGVLIIQDLIKKYGHRIEVVTAGADWDEADYGLKGLIINKGLLGSLEEVGDLYRSCDIGFVFMLSKHPSYQPFEFMACGMATVTNRNEDNLWLFRDRENCLLAEPSPADMAEKISILVDSPALRKKIAKEGQRSINFDWDTELQKIWDYIKISGR
ncbi:hypothetical protein COU91_02795 [Candidatus Saccharibacteria bacterium CG10_big_fil_rev_8_21_14_0_10_47_8]|nr:MAG: hypothetical protein COU91_02795 [Candidatus Saccharibacteria bacterium CG10_big_fil_rev_8_21_14_0_10_47_8]